MFFVWFIRIKQQPSTQNVPDGVKKGRLFYSAIAPHPASTHPASTRSGADGVARIFRRPDRELASGTNRLGTSRMPVQVRPYCPNGGTSFRAADLYRSLGVVDHPAPDH